MEYRLCHTNVHTYVSRRAGIRLQVVASVCSRLSSFLVQLHFGRRRDNLRHVNFADRGHAVDDLMTSATPGLKTPLT